MPTKFRPSNVSGIAVSEGAGGLSQLVLVSGYEGEGVDRRFGYTLCERGSKTFRDVASSSTHWVHGFADRLADVLRANEAYILGAEGLAAIAETAEDRRLAEVVRLGGTMDPETGKICGFDE